MSAGKLTMKKIKDTLKLKFESNLTNRQIAGALGISASTVSCYTRAFTQAKLQWALAKNLSDDELYRLLEPHCIQLKNTVSVGKAEPDFDNICQALRNKCITREHLYAEYQQQYGARAYSYPEYCRRYREFIKKVEPVLRHHHIAGEKIYVDYAGPKLYITNPKDGTRAAVNIFVAVLGASNYTYVDATLTRNIADWLGSHTRMLNFFGGVTTLIIPDNEKSAVTKASRDCAELNANMAAWASHYDTTILPARPRKPKDKAKVEKAVQCVERQILASLQSRQFYSLAECNDAIAPLLTALNCKPFQKITGSRESWYHDIDKPALKPLPSEPYQVAVMTAKRVGLDYHIEVDRHYYSVPYQYIKQLAYVKKNR